MQNFCGVSFFHRKGPETRDVAFGGSVAQWTCKLHCPIPGYDARAMLPPELLDQLAALNLQHREIIGMLNQLSQPSEITSQLILDELASNIKAAFSQADRAIEVSYCSAYFGLTVERQMGSSNGREPQE
jgi:hypothetical protein